MSKVSVEYLEDMERYNKEFNRELYKDMEESKASDEFKEYYAKHLPVDLLTWCRVNKPRNEMVYKQGYWDQIMLIRDSINLLFYSNYKEYIDNPVMVINTHTSKSIELPVYELNLKQQGVKIILRNNFYDWKVSVISNREIDVDFMGLFEEDNNISYLYCEGFKREQVFKSFKEDKTQFTISLPDNFKLYTFMYILNYYLCKTK